ncbi:MAG: HAMP domain-containing histidine kinase [Deltaproteobacteria bacterium]|nr:MAG: HAMP domain-containing histidine kinase [Deltaproteobacteria bacterium]
MTGDYRELADLTIRDANAVNRSLIEKALAMRCVTYLSTVKARLLTNTIFEIDSAKKALFVANTELQQEVLERRRAELRAERARADAEEATRLKDRFVALVSHDLKGPIQVAMASLQLLSSTKELDADGQEYVGAGLDACRRMLTMIERMLTISRVSGGRIALATASVALRQIVNDALAGLTRAASDKGVTVANDVPETAFVHADPDLLVEVVSNLVSNAIKFSEPGHRVRVHVPADRPAALAVSDVGRGVKPELIPDLFKFETRTTTLGTAGEVGSGLGLPMVHEIVSAHGGRVELDTAPGEGTTFLIELPRAAVGDDATDDAG